MLNNEVRKKTTTAKQIIQNLIIFHQKGRERSRLSFVLPEKNHITIKEMNAIKLNHRYPDMCHNCDIYANNGNYAE